MKADVIAAGLAGVRKGTVFRTAVELDDCDIFFLVSSGTKDGRASVPIKVGRGARNAVQPLFAFHVLFWLHFASKYRSGRTRLLPTHFSVLTQQSRAAGKRLSHVSQYSRSERPGPIRLRT